MRTGLTPSTVQWCRCGRFRGRNLADSVAVRRRFRAGVGVFCQTLVMAAYEPHVGQLSQPILLGPHRHPSVATHQGIDKRSHA